MEQGACSVSSVGMLYEESVDKALPPLSLLPAEVGSGGLLLAWHVPEEYQGMKTLGAQADSFSR